MCHGWRAFQPFDNGRSEPHSLLYVIVVRMNASMPGIIIIFVASYFFLAGGIIMQIFSQTTFLQYFANCEAN